MITLFVAAYAILKPSTSAADFVFLPNTIISWLDTNFNFRTFVLAFAICLVPGCLLGSRALDTTRRRLLAGAAIVLVCLEFIQVWIPTRGFSWADVGYTLAGVVTAECLVLFVRCIGWLPGANHDRNGHHRSAEQGHLNLMGKALISSICLALISLQLAYIFLAPPDGSIDTTRWPQWLRGGESDDNPRDEETKRVTDLGEDDSSLAEGDDQGDLDSASETVDLPKDDLIEDSDATSTSSTFTAVPSARSP